MTTTEVTAGLKALSHPARVMLLKLMQDEARFPDNLVSVRDVGVCVNDLAREAGMPQSTASTHLAALARAGLLEITRHGQWRYTRPNATAIARLAEAVRSLATS